MIKELSLNHYQYYKGCDLSSSSFFFLTLNFEFFITILKMEVCLQFLLKCTISPLRNQLHKLNYHMLLHKQKSRVSKNGKKNFEKKFSRNISSTSI